MFEKNDEQYLIRRLAKNSVLLFLGAGFSREAKNKLGSPLPTSQEFATTIWKWLGYKDPYDGTSLQDMYDAVLASGRPETEISSLLESHLLCDEIPREYTTLTKPFWYRIYTTNVDNLVESIYDNSGEPKLAILSHPNDEIADRDQTLGYIQLLHLNGKLPGRPSDITFSMRQYARRAGSMDPLYYQFVQDYATHATIFVGTELNEPLLWQYIELRNARPSGISENRPNSFLITPKISPPKRARLKAFNVIPVEADTATFLTWLTNISKELPSRNEILKSLVPDIALAIEASQHHPRDKKALISFSNSFHRVPVDPKPLKDRSTYLLGASPRWEDIHADLDAPRELTTRVEAHINESLESSPTLDVVAILGSAGSGKSTILRRLGLRLARSGRLVFLTNSEEFPMPSEVAKALSTFGSRAILLFDNAEIALGLLPGLADKLAGEARPPILVVASRTNDFDRKVGRFSKAIKIHEFSVPNLTRQEIESVIQVLDSNSLLGHLQGMNHQQRINEFETRSNKQILIAMREATSGKGFDQIIESEFETLEPQESKVLYLCVALATEAGYRLTEQEFVGCARVTPAEALHLLKRNLKDIVIVSGPGEDMLMLRHRQIAEYAVNQFAPRALMRDAYVRLLQVLANEVRGKKWRSRTFGLYRDVINHLTIFKRFEEEVDEARSIYDALSADFKSDAQFWLQYGSLELEGGSLEHAETYIKAAQSLDSDNMWIQNAMGHLLLRKGIEAKTKSEAIAYRDEGSEILLENIARTDISDAYCYHIYASQRHKWIHQWLTDDADLAKELGDLRRIMEIAVKNYPRNRQLRELYEGIEREYLSLAVRQ